MKRHRYKRYRPPKIITHRERRVKHSGCLFYIVLGCVVLSGMFVVQHNLPSANSAASTVTASITNTPPPLTTLTQGPLPTPAVQTAATRYPQLISALTEGNIETAIRFIQNINDPHAEDVKPLSLGVRLMLDHLYVIDA